MYTLYIANKNYSSWSLRPWVLMRALGIPFEERLERFPDGTASPNFRIFSPSGKVPCLHDGSTVVWDSLAITEYLAERHAGVWPQDPFARAWARCVAAEMHSGFGALRSRCSMTCGVRIEMASIPDDLKSDLRRLEELWNDGLARFGGRFLAGSAFCAVDAFFAPVAFRVQTYGLPLGETAATYVAHLLELPAMQHWYADALAERFRDVPHEAELAGLGRVTADYRAAPESV
jgi:glutathione S-transferase